MRLVRLKNVQIPSIQDNQELYASRPIPKQGIPLHHMCTCLGGTGSGKTTAILEFLEWYDQACSFDRLIVFSPTGMKDPKMKRFIQNKHYFDVTYYPLYTDAIMKTEVASFENDIDDWNSHLKKLQSYQKFASSKSTECLTLEELESLYETDFQKPRWKYPKEYYPSFAVLIDDHVGEKGLFGAGQCKGYLSELCVTHRHITLSIYLLSQKFSNFVPKQLRGGVINLWLLFSTKSRKHMEEISAQVANKVTEETFIRVWEYATKAGPHDFLLVDYKAPPERMFRRNLTHLIEYTDDSKELSQQCIERRNEAARPQSTEKGCTP